VIERGNLAENLKLSGVSEAPPLCHEEARWKIKGRIYLNEIKYLAVILKEFPSF
jgi:hypothetical protein